MKLHLKVLALAALGVAAAAPAHATIANAGSGNGELFLSVWDDAGTATTADDRSYTRDLGSFLNTDWSSNATTPVPNAQANTAGYGMTYAADSLLSGWLAGGSTANMHWNVAGGDSFGVDRVLTTISAFPTAVQSQTTFHNWNTAADTYLAAINAIQGGTVSNNFSNTATSADGNAFAGGAAWGNNMGTAATNGFNNAGGIGQALDFYMFYETSTTTGGMKNFQYASLNNGALTHNSAPAYWTLNSAGTLSYVVPGVPEADTWAMFAAGLLTVGAIARRRLSV